MRKASEPFAVALQVNGTVTEWGDDTFGQVHVPEDLTGIAQIAAGPSHALALKNNGTVYAWGNNKFGQCTVPDDLIDVTSIKAANRFSAALLKDGSIRVWEEFPSNQIPADLTGVTQIATGFDHIVALKSDGSVSAWGNNQFGQSTVPADLPPAKSIAATIGFTNWQGSTFFHDFFESATTDQLHRNRRHLSDFLRSENVNTVRVIDRSSKTSFAKESCPRLRKIQLMIQQLKRDQTPRIQLLGFKNRTHSTPAQIPTDSISTKNLTQIRKSTRRFQMIRHRHGL